MFEQHTDGDAILRPAYEVRNVFLNRVVETDFALVKEDHEGTRGADDFGQGGQIVDRAIGRDGGTAAGPAQTSKALLHHRRAPTANDDRGAGITARRNTSFDDVVDL